MKTFEAIATRRSVKHYDTGAVMPDDDFEKLMSAVLLSPTAYNIQNWRFIRVKDHGVREQIKAAAWGQNQVTDAAELIIICADIKAWQDRPERYWTNADDKISKTLLPMIQNFYQGKEQLQRDEAMRSCGIAAQTLMLGAKALNYDSNPMIGFDTDTVAEIIKLPKQHAISMMIAIGKAKQPANPRGGQLPLHEVMKTDSFGAGPYILHEVNE